MLASLQMPLPFSGYSALYGVLRYLKCPNGVIKVVYNWLSSSSEHWWYPFAASVMVKYFVPFAEVCAAASAVVGYCYLSLLTQQFRREWLTHIRILSDPGYYNRGTPLCHLSNWCDNALLLQHLLSICLSKWMGLLVVFWHRMVQHPPSEWCGTSLPPWCRFDHQKPLTSCH